MEEPTDHSLRQHESVPFSSSSVSINGPSSSSASTSFVQEENDGGENQDNVHHHHHHHQDQQQQSSSVSYRVNISITDVVASQMKDDMWSCLVVLVTFWFFASMTLILGFYGSVNLQLGPNCSHLVQTNSFFVQSIKAQEIGEQKPGPMLYGFYKPPPLEVKISWTETHNAFVPINFRKEWAYFLNKGSEVDISYSVKSPSSLPLSLVIAQGRESLVEWVEDPSSPNTTLTWNIIYGNGKIHQEISKSSNYYIAVGNLNSEEVEVQLKFTLKALIYNTTQAYCRCSLGNHLCTLTLFLLRANVALITSPGAKEGTPYDDWYVKLSYGPRWITYLVGSGFMTIVILLASRFCNMFQTTSEDETQFQSGEMGSEHAPLIPHKDDDLSSWGSSHDSISHDEEDLEERLAVNFLERKPLKEGENINPQRLCVICFDAPRDCFFLPCGHCVACFTCGTRIAEEAGTCPICRRKMKKVRKIFTV